MNERIKELIKQATTEEHDGFLYFDKKKFAELIVRECNQAVSEVPLFYQDYRSQIEAAVIRDCARAVLERFGVEE
jgi:hypothetical protein